MLSQLLQERGRLGERTTARQDVGHVGHVGHGGDVAEGGQVGTIDSRGGGNEGSQASDLVALRMLEKYRVKAARDFVEEKLITKTCVCALTLLGKIDNDKIMF